MTTLERRDDAVQTVGEPEIRRTPGPRWPLLVVAVVAVSLFIVTDTSEGDRLAENSVGEQDTSPFATAPLASVPSATAWRLARVVTSHLLGQTIVATADGFAVLSGPGDEPPAIWSSRAGLAWNKTDLAFAPKGLAPAGDGLIAYELGTMHRLELSGDVWTDPEPAELPVLARLGYLSGRPGLVAFEGVLLVQSPEGAVHALTEAGSWEVVVPVGTWSRDPEDPWLSATAPRLPDECRPPRAASIDYVPFAEAEGGLFALVSGGNDRWHGIWPQCEPSVWVSEDGLTWERLTVTSPFADGSYIYSFGHRNGRFLAVGGVGADRPAIWTSANGITWERLPTIGIDGFAEFQPTRLAAGPVGWVMLGTQANGPGATGWVSVDGTCWERLPPEIQPTGAAVGASAIVITTGDDQMWAGAPTRACTEPRTGGS